MLRFVTVLRCCTASGRWGTLLAMVGPGVARPDTIRVASGLAVAACGWWLAQVALSLTRLFGQPPLRGAFWWLTILLLTTCLIAAGLGMVAISRLQRGSRPAWWTCLALFVVLIMQWVGSLRVRGLGVVLVAVGLAGLSLLLAPSSRRYLAAAGSSTPPVISRSPLLRRLALSTLAVALLAWYAVAGANLLLAAGRIRVEDRPPCDSSPAYTGQTQDLNRWMIDEGQAHRLPIDSVETTNCSAGSLTPGVATGYINPGGTPVVRAGLEQLGCVWRDDYCTVTLNRTHAKVRIHTGRQPILELWPAG
jgi:hypothetical protein